MNTYQKIVNFLKKQAGLPYHVDASPFVEERVIAEWDIGQKADQDEAQLSNDGIPTALEHRAKADAQP